MADDVIDEDRRLGAVRERLARRHLEFSYGGLHFEVRDISAEIAEARQMMAAFLGREPQMPNRPPRFIHLWVVTDDTDEVVGHATREIGLRGSALVVAHKRLRIQPEWRRRGFGSALLAHNRAWYRECGVASIVMEAEGDGSAFAAVRGFDFDVVSYASRPGFTGLSERDLRFAAVDRLMRHPAVLDTEVDARAAPRESVAAFLARLRHLGAAPAEQVQRFEQRLPQPAESGLTGDARTFSAPHEIAAFGQDEPLATLSGSSLGSAVLALTGWSGITSP